MCEILYKLKVRYDKIIRFANSFLRTRTCTPCIFGACVFGWWIWLRIYVYDIPHGLFRTPVYLVKQILSKCLCLHFHICHQFWIEISQPMQAFCGTSHPVFVLLIQTHQDFCRWTLSSFLAYQKHRANWNRDLFSPVGRAKSVRCWPKMTRFFQNSSSMAVGKNWGWLKFALWCEC